MAAAGLAVGGLIAGAVLAGRSRHDRGCGRLPGLREGTATPVGLTTDGRDLDPRLADAAGIGAGQHAQPAHPDRPMPGAGQDGVAPAAGAGTVTSRLPRTTTSRSSRLPRGGARSAAYVVAGGVAGTAAALAGAVELLAHDELRPVSRVAAPLAFGAGSLGGGLLLSDLGRPERVLNFFRVFRPTSVMNMGGYLLAGTTGAMAVATVLHGREGVLGVVGRSAAVAGGVLGIPFAGYTGVLLSSTALPGWNIGAQTLPPLFLTSGAATTGSLLRLAPLGAAGQVTVGVMTVTAQVGELAAGTAHDRTPARPARGAVVLPVAARGPVRALADRRIAGPRRPADAAHDDRSGRRRGARSRRLGPDQDGGVRRGHGERRGSPGRAGERAMTAALDDLGDGLDDLAEDGVADREPRRTATSRVAVQRVGPREDRRVDRDVVVVEEPLRVHVEQEGTRHLLGSTMRTPGHDLELAAGLAVGEGVITAPDQIRAVRPCRDGRGPVCERGDGRGDGGGGDPDRPAWAGVHPQQRLRAVRTRRDRRRRRRGTPDHARRAGKRRRPWSAARRACASSSVSSRAPAACTPQHWPTGTAPWPSCERTSDGTTPSTRSSGMRPWRASARDVLVVSGRARIRDRAEGGHGRDPGGRLGLGAHVAGRRRRPRVRRDPGRLRARGPHDDLRRSRADHLSPGPGGLLPRAHPASIGPNAASSASTEARSTTAR